MWWAPLTTALVLGLLVVVLHFWHQKKQVTHAKAYRARFIQLVAQLDTVTLCVNQLANQVRAVKEPKLLDYYEGTLRMLETLLVAIRKIPPFGSDPSVLDSATFLVRDCRQRVGRIQQAFQDSVRGREVRYDELFGRPGAGQEAAVAPSGCYFCSRPVVSSRFSEVRVRIDDEVIQVLSCMVCKDELEATKKIKVLYFMKDGQPLHWSQFPDYQPSEDYWNINKREVVHKTRKLELVRTPSEGEEPPTPEPVP